MISVRFGKLLKTRTVVHGYSAKHLQFLRVIIRSLSSTKPGAVGTFEFDSGIAQPPKRHPEGKQGYSQPPPLPMINIPPTTKGSNQFILYWNNICKRFILLLAVNTFTCRSHTCGELTKDNVDQKVTIMGWMTFKRFGGRFLVIRDAYGQTQTIIPNEVRLFSQNTKLNWPQQRHLI